jgi:hypothetical protein
MPLDNSTPRSRRVILAGALGAAAAVSIDAIARPLSTDAQAAYVVLGGPNPATSETSITNSTSGDDAFTAYATGTGIGVYGASNAHFGVFGNSTTGTGVKGASSSSAAAAIGQSGGNSTGVFGISGLGSPTVSAKTGVYGYADQGSAAIGVRGASPTGRGGVFKGKAAQIRLVPSSAAGHPVSGQLGDLFVDTNKRLWFCKGGASWVKLA